MVTHRIHAMGFLLATAACDVRQSVHPADAGAFVSRVRVYAVEHEGRRQWFDDAYLTFAPDRTPFLITKDRQLVKLSPKDCIGITGDFAEGERLPNGARLVRGPGIEHAGLIVFGGVLAVGGSALAGGSFVAAASTKTDSSWGYNLMAMLGLVVSLGGWSVIIVGLTRSHEDGTGLPPCKSE